jgi:hypothetical protein
MHKRIHFLIIDILMEYESSDKIHSSREMKQTRLNLQHFIVIGD